jgi:hypothetical protein
MVEIHAHLAALANYRIFVGILPGSKAGRRKDIQDVADKAKSTTSQGRRKKKLMAQAKREVRLSNADMLYMFERGSPKRNQPPRSVLRASIADRQNKTQMSEILKAAASAAIAGNSRLMRQRLEMAGRTMAKNAQDWFTNENNNWSPNAPATIMHKGFDQPGIQYDIMRKAITSFIKRIEDQPKEKSDKPKETNISLDKTLNKVTETTEGVQSQAGAIKQKLDSTLREMEAEATKKSEEAAREAEAEAGPGKEFGKGEIEGLLDLL